MKVSDAFPSKYLSAADLNGGTARVVMQRVEIEKLGEDTKPVLYFKGKTKGLALNKTNSRTIADTYGDEMDEWMGHEIILFPIMTDYQGKTVEAIRVRAPQPKDNKPAARQFTPPESGRQVGGMGSLAQQAPLNEEVGDEIPF